MINEIALNTYHHKVVSTYKYRVPQCMSPRRNWDSPTPLPQASVPFPPASSQPKGEGELRGAHSPAGEGWGSPIFDDWKKA